MWKIWWLADGSIWYAWHLSSFNGDKIHVFGQWVLASVDLAFLPAQKRLPVNHNQKEPFKHVQSTFVKLGETKVILSDCITNQSNNFFMRKSINMTIYLQWLIPVLAILITPLNSRKFHQHRQLPKVLHAKAHVMRLLAKEKWNQFHEGLSFCSFPVGQSYAIFFTEDTIHPHGCHPYGMHFFRSKELYTQNGSKYPKETSQYPNKSIQIPSKKKQASRAFNTPCSVLPYLVTCCHLKSPVVTILLLTKYPP